MKTISKWQKDFAVAAAKKFPNNKRWSQYDRLSSILRQLADVSKGIQREKGLYKMSKEEKKHYKSTDHRIAALIADILLLCNERKTKLEKELNEVLKWFQK